MILTLIIFLSLAVRITLALTHPGFIGVDGGAYLLQVERLLGQDAPQLDFVRPPLAPGWLLAPFVLLMGQDGGYSAFTAISSFAPLPGFLLLAKKVLTPRQRQVATAFFLFDMISAEMIVTGTLPMIGFGLILLVIWAMIELTEGKGWRHGLLLTVSLGLTPWVNQTSAGLAAITLPIILLALGFAKGRMVLRAMPYIAAGAIIGACALPWYMGVAPGSAEVNFRGAWILPAGPFKAVVTMGLLFFASGVWIAWKATDYRIRTLAVALAVQGALHPWLSYDEALMNIFYRAGYLAIPFFWVCVVWVVGRLRIEWGQWFPRTAVAAIFTVLAVGFFYQWNNQADYSDTVTPATAKALEIVKESGDGTAVITNGRLLAIWVGAINHQPAVWTSTTRPPEAFENQDAHARCVAGWVPGCDLQHSVQEIDAGYILVDYRWQQGKWAQQIYRAPAVDPWAELERNAPWLTLLYQGGTTKLWRVERGYAGFLRAS